MPLTVQTNIVAPASTGTATVVENTPGWAKLVVLRMDQPVRLATVSYLNTVPLIWGILHGDQRPRFAVDLAVPSLCSARLAAGEADLGIVPVAEVWRKGWDTVPGCGIACLGHVRTILLLSRKPWDQIKTLAADSGSRTSVLLSRVILARAHGLEPQITAMTPEAGPMLEQADAALLIGDAALRVDPERIAADFGAQHLDLGQAWFELTALPFVFATWSGPNPSRWPWLQQELAASLAHGMAHLEEMVASESPLRGFPPQLVRDYFTRFIRYQIGPAEQAGLDRFLTYAAELERPR
jgi:chorismate dehydratase